MSRQAIPATSLVGCLNSNTTFLSSCLSGSSSLSLRHVAHLLLFARASSPVLQGSVKFLCAWQITSTPQLSYLVLNPLFNSWFVTELVLLLLLLQNFFLIEIFSKVVRTVPEGVLCGGWVRSVLVFAHLFKLEKSWMSSVGCLGPPVFRWINKYWIMNSKWCYCCVIAIVKNTN